MITLGETIGNVINKFNLDKQDNMRQKRTFNLSNKIHDSSENLYINL